jgi:hypothetical protein
VEHSALHLTFSFGVICQLAEARVAVTEASASKGGWGSYIDKGSGV